MTHKIAGALVFTLLVLFVACVPPPPELCKRGIDLQCTRTFECTPDAVKNDGGFAMIYGADVAACKSKFETASGCASKMTENELCQVKLADGGTGPSPTGGTYSLSKASECSDAIKALTCADFLDPMKTPEACKQRCGPP